MMISSQKQNLIRELVLKNLKIRYFSSALGFAWAFLSPFFTVAIFYAVFSLILKIQIKEAPFFLYLMSGVFPWSFFQDSLMSAATSLVDNRNLIKESNFPQYLLPVSIVLANAIIFLPALFILLIAALFIFKGLPVFAVFLPLVLAIHIAITMGLSIIISILYAKCRDIKYILEVVLLLFFYSTPVFYSIYLVKSSFSPLLFKIYIYNPLVGIANLYRAALFKGFYNSVEKDAGFLPIVIVPILFTIAILALGLFLYRKNKTTINDRLAY